MKTASIFTKITFGLLIAGSITACKQKTDTAATTATTPATTTADAAGKGDIAYVNVDTLIVKYNYAKDLDQRMTEKGKAAQSDFQSKGEAFQREVNDYQKSASTMPADQRQTTEQRLQREQQQLQAYQQNASAQLQNERATENGKLYDKLAEYVKTYAKQKGYKMVLTYSKASPTVLYGDPSLDVTSDIVKGLNDAYTKDGGK